MIGFSVKYYKKLKENIQTIRSFHTATSIGDPVLDFIVEREGILRLVYSSDTAHLELYQEVETFEFGDLRANMLALERVAIDAPVSFEWSAQGPVLIKQGKSVTEVNCRSSRPRKKRKMPEIESMTIPGDVVKKALKYCNIPSAFFKQKKDQLGLVIDQHESGYVFRVSDGYSAGQVSLEPNGAIIGTSNIPFLLLALVEDSSTVEVAHDERRVAVKSESFFGMLPLPKMIEANISKMKQSMKIEVAFKVTSKVAFSSLDPLEEFGKKSSSSMITASFSDKGSSWVSKSLLGERVVDFEVENLEGSKELHFHPSGLVSYLELIHKSDKKKPPEIGVEANSKACFLSFQAEGCSVCYAIPMVSV